jgi:hypothetical protein
VTWELYLQHDRKRGIADAPLTQSEISRSAAAELEIDPGHSREYVHSVLFPMSSQSVAALKNINAANVVQLVSFFFLIFLSLKFGFLMKNLLFLET